ncbi:MAG: hypothetical protein KKC05_01670 [Nanoarchaeota archaeon]|nr:hypothetical protein [Nanoarchaeota archaeon]
MVGTGDKALNGGVYLFVDRDGHGFLRPRYVQGVARGVVKHEGLYGDTVCLDVDIGGAHSYIPVGGIDSDRGIAQAINAVTGEVIYTNPNLKQIWEDNIPPRLRKVINESLRLG